MRRLRGDIAPGREAAMPVSDRWSLHAALVLSGLVAADDVPGQRVAEDQAKLFVDLIPAVLIAHALLALPILIMAGVRHELVPMGLAGAAVVIELVLWWLCRSDARAPIAPQRIAGMATIGAMLTGALAYVLADWVFVMNDPHFVPALGAALLAAAIVATLAFAAIPAAAFAYWAMIAMLAAALHLQPAFIAIAAIAMLALAAIMLSIARGRAVALRQQTLAQAEEGRARKLLADFETSGKGWFWETDRDGRLTYLSQSIAAALIGEDEERFDGRSLTDIFEAPQSAAGSAEPQGQRSIAFHLATQLPFSDSLVCAVGAQDERCWSICGRPVHDDYGRFLGFRGNGSDLTEMRRSEAEVSRLARYDSLTGLPNRVLMKHTLEAALRDAQRTNRDCALFLLDLDRFKGVNDTLGHPVGDLLLRQVAERLVGVVGEAGQVGRIGGDEFIVVVPRIASRTKLAVLAEQIIARVGLPYLLEGSQVAIGTSVGIALFPDHGAGADSLTRNADLALYAAKADGKGVHRFYEARMHSDAEERRLLEVDLRNALGSEALSLAYQPLVNAASEAIVGFEVLARWRHPTRGMVSPADFIPIAEEIGLIPRIGEWVLRTACAEAAKWPEHIRVAVNISPLQFANPALPAIVASALAEAQLAPHRLELEITEGVFLNDDAETDTMFARLQAIGVRFALDDFGTGYSSLGYLKKAPFSKIKIDRSFVRGAAIEGSRNAAIIRAIVTLAESLGMETVAEGAETHDELALIRALGCSTIQGFIFGKPMPSDEALARVSTGEPLVAEGFASRRPPRVAVLRKANLMVDGRKRVARLRNISEYGAMIEIEGQLPEDARIELILADGERLGARVRWSQDGRLGMRFDRAFSLEKMGLGSAALERAA